MVAVTLTVAPCVMVRLDGEKETDTAPAAAAARTLSAIAAVTDVTPVPLPRTVRFEEATVAAAAAVRVTVPELFAAVIVRADAVTLAGSPSMVTATSPAKPPDRVTVAVKDAVAPCVRSSVDADALIAFLKRF